MDRLIRRLIFSLLLAFNLSACLATQPRNITNVCDIFEDRRSWYRAARNSEQRWGVPIGIGKNLVPEAY